MKIKSGAFLRAYSSSLVLYPKRFRAQYIAAMMDAAARMQAESHDDGKLMLRLTWDLVRGSVREHLRAAMAPTPAYLAAFGIFFSVLLIVISVTHQQVLRRGADKGPAKLAAQLVGASTLVHFTESVRQPDGTQNTTVDRMMRGRDYQPALGSAGRAEISSAAWLNGTAPFAVLYDAAGRAVEGDATLHGALPQPPTGIFGVIRQRGTYKVTWQPQRGIRVALVGEVLPDGGFVVAGQSLRPSEASWMGFDRLMLQIWALMVVGLGVGWLARTAGQRA